MKIEEEKSNKKTHDKTKGSGMETEKKEGE